MPKTITGRIKIQGIQGRYTYIGRHAIPPRLIHTAEHAERLAQPQDFYQAMPWHRRITSRQN